MKVKVCTGSKCKKEASKELYKKLDSLAKKVNKYIKDNHLDKKELKIKETSCQGFCKHAPNVKIKSEKIKEADFETIEKIILDKYKITKDKLD